METNGRLTWGEGVWVYCVLQSCAGIYPLQNVFLRKVKILKAPKFDVTKLMEVHGDFTEEIGTKVERSEPKGEQEELVGA
jgi:small subunit ribosomal protein S3Ae